VTAHRLTLIALAICLRTAAGIAQPVDASTTSTLGYTRPAREDGALLTTPAPRTVPTSEHALVSATASRAETVGPPRWGLGLLAMALVTGFGVAVTWQLTAPRRRDPSRASERAAARVGASTHPGVEVRCVAVALDWNLRASVEHTLAQVRARADGQPTASAHAIASAARDAIARVHPSIRAAAVQSWSITPDESFAFFEKIVDTMHERAAQQEKEQRPAPPGPPVGVAIAVLTVSTRCPLPPLLPTLSGPSLLSALESLVPPRRELLLSADLTWVPTSMRVALSHAEAGRLFPELTPIASTRPGTDRPVS
jgi:Protein of unknown function (DUF1517)